MRADLTDGAIAIHELRLEFNFNTNLAPVITDGGAFDRLSLTIRADGLGILSMPLTHLASGPLRADGSEFDVDGDGQYEPGVVGVGLSESQHYSFDIAASDWYGSQVADFALMDSLQEGFALDPDGERLKTGCADGVCDGIIKRDEAACATTVSGPVTRKGVVDVRHIVWEPKLACSPTVFVKTVPASSSKGSRDATFFPTSCVSASAAEGWMINRAIPLNKGLVLFDKVTHSLVGTVLSLGSGTSPNPIDLLPVNCP